MIVGYYKAQIVWGRTTCALNGVLSAVHWLPLRETAGRSQLCMSNNYPDTILSTFTTTRGVHPLPFLFSIVCFIKLFTPSSNFIYGPGNCTHSLVVIYRMFTNLAAPVPVWASRVTIKFTQETDSRKVPRMERAAIKLCKNLSYGPELSRKDRNKNIKEA